MRKRVVPEHPQGALADEDWLHVEGLAEVEVTSEALAYPVEGAFFSEPSAGWRASGPGPQTIKLHFQPPQQLTRIALYFVESEMERTQEYTLRWSHGYGESFHEIVRQQWNFSPQGATREIEDHHVELQRGSGFSGAVEISLDLIKTFQPSHIHERSHRC